jgi:hypothetical protein
LRTHHEVLGTIPETDLYSTACAIETWQLCMKAGVG